MGGERSHRERKKRGGGREGFYCLSRIKKREWTASIKKRAKGGYPFP